MRQQGRMLAETLARRPVIASLTRPELLEEFLASPAQMCILAYTSVGALPGRVRRLVEARRIVVVNIDSSPGLAQDKGGLDFVRAMGAQGVVSTRVSLVERARALGLAAVLKVFVTDRAMIHRSVEAVGRSRPDLTELMPWPVIARLPAETRKALGPFVAAGFVQDHEDVAAAIRCSALGAATSDPALWGTTPNS